MTRLPLCCWSSAREIEKPRPVYFRRFIRSCAGSQLDTRGGNGSTIHCNRRRLAAEARWSPDSKQIYYFGHPAGQLAILRKTADGSGSEELILKQDHWLAPKSITPDGRYLLFESNEPESGSDLWLMPLAGEGKPAPFIKTSSNEGNAVLSPDGRWVAYVSDKSGRFEIYVRPFPAPGPEAQISSGTADWVSGGSTVPVDWRRDGKELFYVSADWKVMSVPVNAGAAFSAGAPHPLFAVPPGSQVEATGDGQRFLVNAPIQDDRPASLEVILNWSRELPAQ